jgi:hypothetical protein
MFNRYERCIGEKLAGVAKDVWCLDFDTPILMKPPVHGRAGQSEINEIIIAALVKTYDKEVLWPFGTLNDS